jgi:hypothetical protein
MGTVRQGRAVARRWLAIEPEGGGRIRVGESAHLQEEFGAGRSGHGHGPLDVGLDDGRAVSASAGRLQEVWPPAPTVLAATTPQVIASTALVALGLSEAPVHEPVHGRQRAICVLNQELPEERDTGQAESRVAGTWRS